MKFLINWILTNRVEKQTKPTARSIHTPKTLQSILYLDLQHFNFDVFILHSCLAAEAIGVAGNAHILLAVVAWGQAFHTGVHIAHTGRAKAVPSTGMLHGNVVIECDFENTLAFLGFDHLFLAIDDEGDFRHGWGV